MTANEFRAALAALEFSQRDFAMFTGCTQHIVRRWLSGEREIPRWLPMLLSGPGWWRPIETNPHDGGTILLWNGETVEEGAYSTHYGYWVSANARQDCRPQPTHWMPLPAPPVLPLSAHLHGMED